MIIKKLSYLLILSYLQLSNNLIASNCQHSLKKVIDQCVPQIIDKNIIHPKLLRIAIHEAGHAIHTIKYPLENLRVGYATISRKGISNGHVQFYRSEFLNYTNKKYIEILLAGAAAEAVYDNIVFTDNNDILKYLQHPRFGSDMAASQKILQYLGIHDQNDINMFIANIYEITAKKLSEHKDNTFKIASELIQNTTLSETDLHRILKTYTPHEKNVEKSFVTIGNNNTSTKEIFYRTGELGRKASFKDDQLTKIKYYKKNGIMEPRYIVDRKNERILLKSYSDTKITIQEHEMNGQPKIGPAQSKNYKYGYNNNLDYIGHVGRFDKQGNNKKGTTDQLDYGYDNNLQRATDGKGQFNALGRDRHGNLAELD